MKQQKGVLEHHPNGKLVKRANPNLKLNVDPKAFSVCNAEEKFRYDIAKWLFSRDFLPMPVEMSPVLCYISPKEWQERHSDSITVISMLRTIIECYGALGNERSIKAIKHEYDEGIKKLEQNVIETMRKLLNQYHAAEKDTLTEYVMCMKRWTIERIRLMEKQALGVLQYNGNEDEDEFLTPFSDAPVVDMNRFLAATQHFFQTKEQIRNGRMEKRTAEYHGEIKYFDVEAIKHRMTTMNKDEVFGGFIDRHTLLEYFRFMDYDQILK